MKTTPKSENRSGFTLTELMIIVAIIGLLAAIALPNLAHARDNSRLNTIYSNLRVLESAKDQYALDNNKATGTTVDSINTLSDYFRLGSIRDLVRETYVPNPIGSQAEADLPASVQLGPYGPGAAILPLP